MQQIYDNFINALAQNEEVALTYLETLLANFPKEEVLPLLNANREHTFKQDNHSIKLSGNALVLAMLNQYQKVSEKLIKFGVDVNATVTALDDKNLHGQFPLYIAVQNNDLNLAKLLIDNGAQIIQQTGNKSSVLMAVKSDEMMLLINKNALVQHKLETLLGLANDQGLIVHQLTLKVSIVNFILKAEFSIIWFGLKNGFEDNVLSAMKRIMKLSPQKASEIFTKVNFTPTTGAKFNLLFAAVYYQYQKVTEFLLGIGVSANNSIADANQNSEFHQMSPLMMACQKNNIEIAELLIQHGANILYKKPDGTNAFTIATKSEIRKLLLNVAIEDNDLYQLLFPNQLPKKNKDAFYELAKTNNIGLINELMTIENFEQNFDVREFLHYARTNSFKSATLFNVLNNLCHEIRKFQKKRPELEIKNLLDPNKSHNDLFHENLPDKVDTKEKAIKAFMAQLKTLFDSEIEFMKYIKFINEIYLKYYQEKFKHDFPILNDSLYRFINVDGIQFPAPLKPELSQFKLPEGTALPEFLIGFIRHLIPETPMDAVKLFGLVPETRFLNLIKDQTKIKETFFGTVILHGTLSHLVQDCVIALLLTKNEEIRNQLKKKNCFHIDTKYGDNETTFELTLKDIAEAFATLKPHEGDEIWTILRDRNSPSGFTGCSPDQLNAKIASMQEPGMSTCFKHILCKGFIKTWEGYRNLYNKNLSFDDFIDGMQDIDVTIFNKDLFLYSLEEEKRKILEKGINKYAIVKKEYKPNSGFFKTYAQSSQEKKSVTNFALKP